MIAAYLTLLYLSSYVYIVTDIDVRNWNCTSPTSLPSYSSLTPSSFSLDYNNCLNMSLCGVAIIAGLLFKATGRYKAWQVGGLIVRIIGYVRPFPPLSPG